VRYEWGASKEAMVDTKTAAHGAMAGRRCHRCHHHFLLVFLIFFDPRKYPIISPMSVANHWNSMEFCLLVQKCLGGLSQVAETLDDVKAPLADKPRDRDI